MRRSAVALVVLLAIGTLGTAGCTRVPLPRAQVTTQSEHTVVALKGAKSVDAQLVIGVGQLKVSAASTSSPAGGADLMTADFVYAPASWKPQVAYAVGADGVGRLEVRQPEGSKVPVFQDTKNAWDLTLAPGVPMKLALACGVGTNDIDLRGIDVRELSATTGVGDSTIDLSGKRASDVAVDLHSGVGKLVVKVPRSMGVRVTGRQDGVGSFSADGFIAQGDTWVTQAYSGSGPKMEISIQRGVGDIRLELVD